MDLSNRFSSNGNGHVNDVLASLGMENTPKPAGESASLPGETPTSVGTSDSPAQTQNEERGRDAAGRFTRGNKGGPGNPFNRRIAEFRRRFQEKLTDEVMDEIIDNLIQLARQKDRFGLRMVLEYNLDKRVQPDRVNIEEAEIIQKEADIFTNMPGLLSKPEPSLPLMMLREARSGVTGQVGHMMANLLACPQERIPEMQNVLTNDPKMARDWLDNGVPPRRKETRAQRKARKARRGKRSG